MVAHDAEFKVDLTKLSDDDLWKRRQKFVGNLYAGYDGSIDNVEKKALIAEIDAELARRNTKSTGKRATIAVIISIAALIVSIGGFLLNIWVQTHLNQLK